MSDVIFKKLMNLLFEEKSTFPKDMRIFVPAGNKYVYVNNGHASVSFSIQGLMSDLKSERGAVLDAFAKFEFVIFEMLRFTIGGVEATKTILEVVKTLSSRQRINILHELKIIDKPLSDMLSQIIEIRNGFAHKFSVSEVIYNNKPIFETNNFQQFQTDLQKTWDLLAEEYHKMLQTMDLEPILQKIQLHKESIPPKSSSAQDKTQQD